MGPVVVGGTSIGTVAGRPVAGRVVSVGNPHLVCAVSDLTTLAALDLTSGVAVDPADFPDGANVEFVVPGPPAGPVGPLARADGDSVTMRVHERGVGETRSCGTGTVAVAAAHLFDTGAGTGTVLVRVPGGTVTVEVGADTALLTGPAVIVARGELSAEFLAAAG